jgi:hypothetical protein
MSQSIWNGWLQNLIAATIVITTRKPIPRDALSEDLDSTSRAVQRKHLERFQRDQHEYMDQSSGAVGKCSKRMPRNSKSSEEAADELIGIVRPYLK